MSDTQPDRFLAEALSRNLLTAKQHEICVRIASSLTEVTVEMTSDEIAVRKGFLSREQADSLKRALARLRVGRYEVVERLGEGAAGVVWKARDTVLDRMVALKLLSNDARASGQWRDSFLREARVAVTLNHERVVRGLDCGEADGHLFFAMEFVPGGSLADRVQADGRLPEITSLNAGLDVVSALRYIHSFGLVHRDLKPENLLVSDDAHVKVCDLGLAKPLREQAEQREGPGLATGTPLYMSPEQIKDGERVDWRSDVYSLGATLFHLLTGRPVFLPERGRDVLSRHLNDAPPSPREFALDVSPETAAVVLKMLQKAPEDRYRSLDDLESDLRSALAGRPPIHTITFAPKDRPGVELLRDALPPRRPVSPRKRAAVAVAGLVVAGAIAAGVWAQLKEPVVPPESAASQGAQTTSNAGASGAEPATPPRPKPRTAEERARAAREAEARAALDAVLRRMAADRAVGGKDDSVAARAEFLFLAERYQGTAAGDVAKEKAEILSAEIERRAEEEFAKRAARAGVEQAAGRYARAMAEFDEMPAHFAATTAGRRAEAERLALRDEAVRVVDRLLAEAYSLAQAAEFADAKARISSADLAGISERRRDVEVARRAVTNAESDFATTRAEQARRFDEVFATAVLMLGSRGERVAAAWLDASMKDVSAWKSDLLALRADLAAAAGVSDRVDGSSAAGTGPDAKTLRAVLFARLAKGRLADAEALLPRLTETESGAESEREAVRRVRALLEGEAADLLALAEQSRAAKRYEEAEDCVNRALTKVPGHLLARALLAAIDMDKGRLDQAIAALEPLTAGVAPPPEAHLYLAQALVRRHRDEERAEREFRQFLLGTSRDDPRRAGVQAAIDEILARQREVALRDARAKLRRAIAKRDNDATLLAADEVLLLAGDDADALLAAGLANINAQRWRPGWRILRKLAETRKNTTAAAQAEVAIDDLERRLAATAATREDARAAREQLDQGELDLAVTAFDRVLATAPFLEDALLGAGEARLLRRGPGTEDDLRAATELLSDLLLRNHDHARGLTLHAEALLRARDFRLALDEARRAMDLDRARPDPAAIAGDAVRGLGDAQAALDFYRESLDRRRTPRALLGRALAWEALGSKQNATVDVDTLLAEFKLEGDITAPVDALLQRLGFERAPLPAAPNGTDEAPPTPPRDGNTEAR